MRLFGDMTDAEFDSGGNVPRIPAAKIGAELRFFAGAWSAHLHVTDVQEQDDAAFLELPTDGYTNVSLYADYHFDVANDSELKVFVRGNNLLDDEIRNHASFLRNFAPEPGRGFMVGLRFEY
jgi:iron complex outermembrane receptor protein